MNPSSKAFGLSAAIAILVNAALACMKDAWKTLDHRMASLAGHSWTAQGIVDVAVFVCLGFVFLKSGWTERIAPERLAAALAAATILATVAMVSWYALT